MIERAPRASRGLTHRALRGVLLFAAAVALWGVTLATASAADCTSTGTGSACQLSTSIINASGQPVTTSLVGSAVYPVAVLSTRTPPTGTVTFDWYANGTCEGTPVATSAPVTVTNGVASGTEFAQIPRKVGAYAFAARYSGDGSYAATSGECRPLTVPRFAPQVLGSSVAINMTSGESVTVGGTATFDVALTVTGDTTLAGLTVTDIFENEFLTLAGPLPDGCVLQAQQPDPRHDTINCTIGRVPLGISAREFTRSLPLAFRAVRGTAAAATTNSAQASFTFEGFGQTAPAVIGPTTASIQIIEPPRLALPPETSGTQGEQIDIPVRLRGGSLSVPTTFTFDLSYDPNLLRIESVLPGQVASAEGLRWSLTRPGLAAVSAVSSPSVSVVGELGSLVVARFTVLGSNGESTLRVENVRAVALLANAVPITVDSGQGTVIVTPVVPAQVEPPVEEVLPDLWDPSLWTAEHVTKSLGYSALLVATLTFLAEMFNATIEENRHHFPGWWRRWQIRRAGGRGQRSPEGAPPPAGHPSHSGARTLALGAGYLLAGSVIFALLKPEHVFAYPTVALTAAATALVVTTGASQLPRWFYVRYLHWRGVIEPVGPGRPLLEVHAEFWTLLLACATVVLALLTQVRPGYVYGIVGVLALARHVRVKPELDRGQLQPWRMNFAGMACLLVVAVGSWVGYSLTHGEHGGHGELVPTMLQEVWAFGAETVALGLVPLSFLPGKSLWNWNRPAWAVLWGTGLFMYAQALSPADSAAGPLAIALTLLGYAAITLGFWSYFRYMHDEATCESCLAADPELAAA